MSDDDFDWKDYGERAKKEKQDRHAKWKEKNLKDLKASGMKFTFKSEVALFRDEGMPKVDFYPSTGRWRIVGVPGQNDPKSMHSGGAHGFMRWYAKQEKTDASTNMR